MGVWIEMYGDRFIVNDYNVTPFVGVWIEILENSPFSISDLVTPFVGVWIEILYSSRDGTGTSVTPFVGVWIEICGYICGYWNCRQSLPLWECGLKFIDYMEETGKNCHSLRGSVD